MLEVEHVSKKFKDHQVLVDVNLKVNQGDVVVILGPSGSGKTTFLRCLNHLEKADTGHLKRQPLFFSITIYLPTKQHLKISWKD